MPTQDLLCSWQAWQKKKRRQISSIFPFSIFDMKSQVLLMTLMNVVFHLNVPQPFQWAWMNSSNTLALNLDLNLIPNTYVTLLFHVKMVTESFFVGVGRFILPTMTRVCCFVFPPWHWWQDINRPKTWPDKTMNFHSHMGLSHSLLVNGKASNRAVSSARGSSQDLPANGRVQHYRGQCWKLYDTLINVILLYFI